MGRIVNSGVIGTNEQIERTRRKEEKKETSAIYSQKYQKSVYKGGIKGYQNSSWDIWSAAKQFLVIKYFGFDPQG